MRILTTVPLTLLLGMAPVAGGPHAGQPKPQSVYDAVTAGMVCKQSTHELAADSQLECTYRVGSGLVFQLVGVGEPDVNIGVRKAGGYDDSDFVFDFSMGHRCVIVSASNRRLPSDTSHDGTRAPFAYVRTR